MSAASLNYAHPPQPHSSFPSSHALPPPSQPSTQQPARQKSRGKRSEPSSDSSKRRCVSTACVACRKRKSKCDGNTPACAACSSVYGTECVYDPNSDLRRKGVYRQDVDNLKDRDKTLQTLIEAILNYPQDEVSTLVRQIRTCQSLEALANRIQARDPHVTKDDPSDAESPDVGDAEDDANVTADLFEAQLSSKLGQLRVESGSTRFFGGTSNLVFHDEGALDQTKPPSPRLNPASHVDPVSSWTTTTNDRGLIIHLLDLYFTWHYTFFVTLSKSDFYKHFLLGRLPPGTQRRVDYCTPLLVNAMLALGCHFTARPDACEDPSDPATAGDHFFKEAKRLIMEEEEYEHPRLATVQALALMSVREAGCGREAKGWAYSGIAFRMACDLGLNLDAGGIASKASSPDEQEEDARRMTFWGCFLFDKCWSNYLGRLPHFQSSVNITCPKFDVFPEEEAGTWSPYSDDGPSSDHSQPSRIRTVAMRLMDLCDISSDLMKYFYHPQEARNPPSKQIEIKRLAEIHTRLENWKRDLPGELESKEGALPSVLIMHMFFHLLYIHLFRPFLKYAPKTSPLPSNVSPRRQCTHGATNISKLLRLYKRSYGLRQICNIVVYIAHSACTIHLLNLPDKNARRDINHGVKQLEEIARSWPCARRTLAVLSMQARKWKVELPDEAAIVLQRFGPEYAIDTPGSGSPHAVKSAPSPGSATSHSSQHPPPAVSEYDLWASNDGFNSMDTDGMMLDNLDMSFDSLMQQQSNAPQYAYTTSQAQELSPHGTMLTSPDEHHSQQSYASAFASPITSNPMSPQDAMFPLGSGGNWPRTTSGSTSATPMSAKAEPSPFPHSAVTSATASPTQSQLPGYVAMQPPPVPRQQHHPLQRPQAQHQSSQLQQPARRQASDASRPKPSTSSSSSGRTTTPSSQPSAPSVRRASATDSMFGGVQALLSESHDFWLRDQSEIANGFGNWRAAAAAATQTQQQQQHMQHAPHQPQHQVGVAQDPSYTAGQSPASSTASGSVNGSATSHPVAQNHAAPSVLDRTCAVPVHAQHPSAGAKPSKTGTIPCSGPVDCESHSLAAKRAVVGRSRPFDALLGAELARRWEAGRAASMGNGPGPGAAYYPAPLTAPGSASGYGAGVGASRGGGGTTGEEWCG